jgi:Fe-Mn family superoxide dismutase
VKTGNADTPIAGESVVPLAVIDVWEHAYYLDYQNRRADYASALFDKLLNWRFVEANLATA